MTMTAEEIQKLIAQHKSTGAREIRIGSLQVRKDDSENQDDGYYYIEGKPITFNDKTELFRIGDNSVYEVIEPDCLKEADLSDIVLNVNHGDGNHCVARTRNKTLELNIQKDGAYIRAKLKKDNPRCVQFYQDVSEGLLDRMSFAFTIAEESFDEDERTFHIRKIRKVYDVSAVEFPAYENTGISANRSAKLENLAKELESRVEAEKLNARRKALIENINKALATGE